MMLGEIDTSNNFFCSAPMRSKCRAAARLPRKFSIGETLCSRNTMDLAPWTAHCALLRVALTFRITRLYEVREGEPLSVTARIM